MAKKRRKRKYKTSVNNIGNNSVRVALNVTPSAITQPRQSKTTTKQTKSANKETIPQKVSLKTTKTTKPISQRKVTKAPQIEYPQGENIVLNNVFQIFENYFNAKPYFPKDHYKQDLAEHYQTQIKMLFDQALQQYGRQGLGQMLQSHAQEIGENCTFLINYRVDGDLNRAFFNIANILNGSPLSQDEVNQLSEDVDMFGYWEGNDDDITY